MNATWGWRVGGKPGVSESTTSFWGCAWAGVSETTSRAAATTVTNSCYTSRIFVVFVSPSTFPRTARDWWGRTKRRRCMAANQTQRCC